MPLTGSSSRPTLLRGAAQLRRWRARAIASQPPIPEAFREFACGEYFGEPLFFRGVFFPEAQLQVVYPAAELRILSVPAFLAIGSAGADGIEFGYRRAHQGLWAFHPQENRFQFVANSLAELVQGYRSGVITV